MLKWLPLAATPSPSGEWFTSGCSGAEPRARWSPDGTIETTAVLEPRAFPTAVNQWASLIASSAAKHGVPGPLVAAFMATESGGNPNAATPCCYGLMGFLPRTASWVLNDFKPEAEWKRLVTSSELLSDTSFSVDLGAKFIRWLSDKYNGNVVKMAGSYNAGSVKCGAPKNCPTAPNQWKVITDCAGGKAVDYPGRIILFNNAAVTSGLFGPGAAGGAGKGSSLFFPVLLVGGAAAVWYFGKRRRAA